LDGRTFSRRYQRERVIDSAGKGDHLGHAGMRLCGRTALSRLAEAMAAKHPPAQIARRSSIVKFEIIGKPIDSPETPCRHRCELETHVSIRLCPTSLIERRRKYPSVIAKRHLWTKNTLVPPPASGYCSRASLSAVFRRSVSRLSQSCLALAECQLNLHFPILEVHACGMRVRPRCCVLPDQLTDFFFMEQ